MSIAVAVSQAQLATDPQVVIPGLTPSYLSSLDRDTPPATYAQVHRSAFKMPFLHKTPIVLVVAGTGIAPFRAFLKERAQMAQMGNQEIGQIILVFGRRNPDTDYPYKEELEAIRKGIPKGKLEIITAFSRVPGEKKIYVQDRLAEPEIQETIRRLLCEDEATLMYHCRWCGESGLLRRCTTSSSKEREIERFTI